MCLWLLAAGGCKHETVEPKVKKTPLAHSVKAEVGSAKQTPAALASLSPTKSAEDIFREALAERCLAQLQSVAHDDIVVSAVIEANRANQQTPEQILEKDAQWRKSTASDCPLLVPFLTNPCAEFLKSTQKEHPQYLEIFVMDNKGCIVGESNRTSDYWQGDEDKWIRSFNAGKGTVFIDEVAYDQSTQSYVVQMSVPIFDSTGATIGAMTTSVQAKGNK